MAITTPTHMGVPLQNEVKRNSVFQRHKLTREQSMDVAVFSEAATPKSTLKKASRSTVSCELFNIFCFVDSVNLCT